MKLVSVLLLSLVALVAADTSYQDYQNYYQHGDGVAAPSYQNQYQAAAKRAAGGLAGLVRQYFSPIRRQAGIPIFSFIAPLALLGLLIAALVIGVTYYAATFNNSGRGLDTDEWEVDHSVWMDQLSKDFEDSWSQT